MKTNNYLTELTDNEMREISGGFLGLIAFLGGVILGFFVTVVEGERVAN